MEKKKTEKEKKREKENSNIVASDNAIEQMVSFTSSPSDKSSDRKCVKT